MTEASPAASKAIAFLDDAAVVQCILAGLGLPTVPPPWRWEDASEVMTESDNETA